MGYFTTFSAPDGGYIEFRRKPMTSRAKQAISRALKGKKKRKGMSGRAKAALGGAAAIGALALLARRKKGGGGGGGGNPPPPNLRSTQAQDIYAQESIRSLARRNDPVINLDVRDRPGRAPQRALPGRSGQRALPPARSGLALPAGRSLPALPASGAMPVKSRKKRANAYA